MPPKTIFLVLFSLFSWSISFAQVSEEGQNCFQWFSSLGLPNTSDAPYAEIWTGAYSKSDSKSEKANTIHGFILRESHSHFTVFGPDLIERTLVKTPPDYPIHKQVSYVKRDLPTSATEMLKSLQNGLGSDTRLSGSWLKQKADIFFIAHACWRQGDVALAAQLFEQAKNVRIRSYIPKETNTLQELLEVHYGEIAMWDTILRFTGSSLGKHRFGYAEFVAYPERIELLERLQDNMQRFPRSKQTDRASESSEVLAQMIREDQSHPTITQEQLDQLPLDLRIDELIWQLRNQNGYQMTQPGVCDIFNTLGSAERRGTSPAHQLVSIGEPAIPALIKALTDRRFSRSVGYARHNHFNHTVLTVGDCAQQILNRIAGYRIHTPTYVMSDTPYESYALERQQVAQRWWEEYQRVGKKQILITAIGAGTQLPGPLVKKLKAESTSPETITDSLLRGLEHTQHEWAMHQYIYEISQLPEPESIHTLRRLMLEHPDQQVRVEAASRLLNEDYDEALAALLNEWNRFQNTEQSRAKGIFRRIVSMLIASGSEIAMQHLVDNWDQRPARERFIIVSSMEMLSKDGNVFRFGYPQMVSKPATKEARAIAVELLAHASNDTTRNVFNGSRSDFHYSNPRIGDYARLVLSKIGSDEIKATK